MARNRAQTEISANSTVRNKAPTEIRAGSMAMRIAMHDNSINPLKDVTLRAGRFAPKFNAFNGRDRAPSKMQGRRLGAIKTLPTGGLPFASGPPSISVQYANASAVDRCGRANSRERKRLRESNAGSSPRNG